MYAPIGLRSWLGGVGADMLLQVSAVSRELSGENFTKFINEVNRRIFELVNSNDINDKVGGILAISASVRFLLSARALSRACHQPS